MILSIDTTDSSVTKVVLHTNESAIVMREKTDHTKSQNLLPLIEKLLERENVDFEQLTGITVVIGHGSFTGIRVGVSVANALGWVLTIPVNGNKPPVVPTYDPSVFDQNP